jgi:hypothetical protein
LIGFVEACFRPPYGTTSTTPRVGKGKMQMGELQMILGTNTLMLLVLHALSMTYLTLNMGVIVVPTDRIEH